MVVLLKTFAGIDYPLKKGGRVVLHPNGVMNVIDDGVWEQALKEHKCLEQMINDGFIVTGTSKNDFGLQEEVQTENAKLAFENQEKVRDTSLNAHDAKELRQKGY